jgi:membrane associated rhomboid family serine protease
MCPNCRAFITVDDKVCPYCEMKVGPPAIARRSAAEALGGIIPHARFTTMMILLINTGFFIATVLYSSRNGGRGGFDLDGQTLFDFGAKQAQAIFAGGQWWRLITAGFLHGGLLHILMNSWVLFDLGVQVEQAYGTSRYLVFYFVSTITGFLASSYWSPYLSIGASAGIFGLIGAMIALGMRDRSSYGAAVRSIYVRWAMYGLAMGILPSLIGISFMDNAAHIGGIAGGFLIAYVAGTPGYSRTVEGFWRAASGVAIAITALAFVRMFLWLTTQTR